MVSIEDFKSISVIREPKKGLVINNPTNYQLIGKGKQGAVFKLSPKRCVKIFALEKHAKMETNVYKLSQNSPIIPKLYEYGSKYIVMEFINGITLDKYLEKEGVISKSLTEQILFMLKEMKRLNFTRFNARLDHIFITKDGTLRLIDHVNSFKTKDPRPIRLLKKLKRLGLLNSFLKQVKKIDKKTYLEWKVYMSEYFK